MGYAWVVEKDEETLHVMHQALVRKCDSSLDQFSHARKYSLLCLLNNNIHSRKMMLDPIISNRIVVSLSLEWKRHAGHATTLGKYMECYDLFKSCYVKKKGSLKEQQAQHKREHKYLSWETLEGIKPIKNSLI